MVVMQSALVRAASAWLLHAHESSWRGIGVFNASVHIGTCLRKMLLMEIDENYVMSSYSMANMGTGFDGHDHLQRVPCGQESRDVHVQSAAPVLCHPACEVCSPGHKRTSIPKELGKHHCGQLH